MNARGHAAFERLVDCDPERQHRHGGGVALQQHPLAGALPARRHSQLLRPHHALHATCAPFSGAHLYELGNTYSIKHADFEGKCLRAV